jgi:hypothetical protein
VLSDLLHRLRAMFRRNALERELEDELRFHFERQVEKYVLSGLTRAEAVRRARLTFGGLEQLKEECRDARGVRFFETVLQDCWYALRLMRRYPVFTAAVVISLGATCCIAVEGYTPGPSENRQIRTNSVTPRYFENIGLPLLLGHNFGREDAGRDQRGPHVAIINETMAHHYFGNVNPIGRHFGWGADPQNVNYDTEIIGVANVT